MTPDLDALTALLEAATAFSEEASPGPWWRETGVATSKEEHMVWLTNEGGDTLMVNADDAAMLVNALPSLLEAVRREAGLREALRRLVAVTQSRLGLTLQQWREEENAALKQARSLLAASTGSATSGADE